MTASLMVPPPRADDIVAKWADRTAIRGRRVLRIVAWWTSVAMLLFGVLAAAILSDEDVVTRILFVFVPWFWTALPFTLVVRYANRWTARQVTRIVRDGVAHHGKVVKRWYSAAGPLLGIGAEWVEGGRVVTGRIELWGDRDIDETTAQVTVVAIPGDRYVAALIGPELLAIGKVKRRTRPAGPVARVVTSLIAIACIATGCHKDESERENPFPWGPRRADSLQVGPYKVTIPPTWRDLSESLAKGAPSLSPGTVGMTPEGAAQGAYRLNIMLTWVNNPPGGTTDCETYAKAISKSQDNATVGHLKVQSYPQGPGCTWDFDTPDGAGVNALRFEQDHVLAVSCTKMKSLGTGIDPECLHVLSELNLQR